VFRSFAPLENLNCSLFQLARVLGPRLRISQSIWRSVTEISKGSQRTVVLNVNFVFVYVIYVTNHKGNNDIMQTQRV
jgi:hypothetical protein